MNSFLFSLIIIFWFAALTDFISAKMGFGINEEHFIFKRFYIDPKKAKKREVQMLFGRSLMAFVIGVVVLIIVGFGYYNKYYMTPPQNEVDLSRYDFKNLNLTKPN